jgi:hypothetical protein
MEKSSLYRRVLHIPAKKLVDEERGNSIALIGVLLMMSGFVQGYLVMDSAFDFKLWYDSYSYNAGVYAFTYYTTILNNRFVNAMTFVAILSTHLCSFYGWTRNIIRKRNLETDLSLSFRDIFIQYCLGTLTYLVFIIPRYIVFINDFRAMGAEELVFDPTMVTHTQCLNISNS